MVVKVEIRDVMLVFSFTVLLIFDNKMLVLKVVRNDI